MILTDDLRLFNPGTHHRGQVHALLAAGATANDIDVPFLASERYPWLN